MSTEDATARTIRPLNSDLVNPLGESKGDGCGEGGEEEEQPEEVEEAAPVRMTRDPGLPTKEEREAHEATHLPFRSWCGECVRGRAPNPDHRRVEEKSDEVPEVGMDHAFVSRQEDKKQLTILVMKDRDTRTIMANVVQSKGAGLDETVDQAVKNIDRLGLKCRMTLKVDNEPA